MKRQLPVAAFAALLSATAPAAAQSTTICTSLLETQCGSFELPVGLCSGTACLAERPARICPGTAMPDGSIPSATQRVLADADDYDAGRAMQKIAAARAVLQPGQSIVRDVLFTCRSTADQPRPASETAPDTSVKLPEPVEQVYKDVQIRAFDPYGLSSLSRKFDIVVRDTSVLSFTAGIPPFQTIVEGEEASGTVGVFGGEGQVVVGMTGAPSWMVLSTDSFRNTSGRNFAEDVVANPPVGSAGSYGGIRIVAQDSTGRRTESPPFSIQVVAQDGLRILSQQGDVAGKVGDSAYGYIEARSAKKWISFDMLGGPSDLKLTDNLRPVNEDGGVYAYPMLNLKTAGTWPNVVYRAVDDQGRKAYSAPFKIVVTGSTSGPSGLPPVVSADAPSPLGFRSPYTWTWTADRPVAVTVDGVLPTGLGLCTNGSLGICGTPTEFGKWSGSITFTGDGGGTKSIPFHFENQPEGWLQPCRGRFSPMNDLAIDEDDDSYTISGATDRTIYFCTSPYDQMDGGRWSIGDANYSSWYKSSSTYDFIYPQSSLPLGYSFYGNALSIPFGDPPPEVWACLNRNPFCTDNVSFEANALLGSVAPGSRAGPVYLTGRDWKGRFWGSKKIYLVR
jgi:hypothetical protein